jgi:hypothetical protein
MSGVGRGTDIVVVRGDTSTETESETGMADIHWSSQWELRLNCLPVLLGASKNMLIIYLKLKSMVTTIP